jgi:hypothetical protein
MKSKIFRKKQNKAKIGQKSQNWPKRPKKNLKSQICQKSQNYPKFGFFVKILAWI